MADSARALQEELEVEIVDHLLAGSSVDLLGVKGSGRSVLLRGVTRLLDGHGWQVVRVDGLAALSDRPLEVLAVAGFVPARNGGSPVAAAVEALDAHARVGRTVVIADDVDDLDTVTAGVLTAFHSRTRTPLLSVSRPLPARLREAHRLPEEVRPGVQITVRALDFVGTQSMLDELLPGAIATELARRVHSLSGGIPALVAAIARAGDRHGLIVREGGVWEAGPDLWHAEVTRTVEPLLQDLSVGAREALETLALAGTLEARLVRRLVGWERLEELDECRLLRFVTLDGVTHVGVFPPIVAEYLRRSGSAARRLRLDETLADALAVTPDGRTPGTNPAAEALSPPGPEAEHESDAVFHRLLLEHWRRERLVRKAAWETSSTPTTAVAYLRALLVGDADAVTLRNVLERTPQDGDPRAMATLTSWHALVLAFVEKDLPAAQVRLAGSHAGEDWDPMLAAVESHLAMLLDDVSDDDPLERFAGAAMSPEAADAVATTRAERLAFLGDPAAARELLEGLPPDRSDFGQGREVLYGLTLVLDARLDEGLAWARRHLADGRARLDVDAIHGHGYVVAMALFLSQRLTELRQHLASVLATGLASGTQRPYEAANLSLASGIALQDGRMGAARAFAGQASVRSIGLSPLPGTTPSWTLARLDTGRDGLVQGREPDAADALWQEYESLLRRGYRIAAVAMAGYSLDLHPDPARAEEVLALARSLPAGHARQTARFVRALVTEDPDEARHLGASLLADGQILLGVRAVVAAVRAAGQDGPQRRAEERERAQALVEPHGPEAVALLMTLAPPGDLSDREQQVAELAADGLSNQQIARRLTLSVRTVENHLFRVFRKLAISHRAELADALRR
ncbi:LuxR C-terminal-related transcriptional regulator [Isoptericola sp. NPDC057653]|uniref:LuxR C-terminal-related transcriptional regulator n=1 Tax=Isoptericola sp. NPDC057653 TaxID=3346195 RepID=UPI0036C45005